MRTSSLVALLLAGCATNGLAGPDAIPVEPGSVRLELVRYAGRMTAHAWVDDRLRSEGVHVLHIAIEPDTVGWSVTFRVVRERSAGAAPELLANLDLDSVMVPPIDARRYPLPSVRFVRGTPDRAIAGNRSEEPA